MKQERHATTLAEDLQEASANTAEYGEFFTGLTGITDRKPVDDALGERIQGYVLGWLEGHPLTAFDDYSATAYRRTYLGRSPETGWEHEHPCPPAVRRLPLRRRQVPARNLRARRRRHGTSGAQRRGRSPVCILRNREAGMFRQPHTPHHLPEPHGAQPARLFGRRTPRRGIRRSG